MSGKNFRYAMAAGIIVLFGISCVSTATIIEYPLDCAGTYGFGDSWESDFDLGVEFIDIKSVSINWSGEFNAGRAVKYSSPDDPYAVDVGFWADFNNNQDIRFGDISGGKNTYPNPESFNTISLVILYFDATWSDLLDGKGHVDIFYIEPIILDGDMIESGTVLLNDAKIIVDGTLVPEPSTLILLALGAVGLSGRRKKAFRIY